MTNAQLIPAVLTPLLIWRFYRRFRRNVGRQLFKPRRSVLVVVAMVVLIGLIGATAAPHREVFASFVGGCGLGALVGLVGLRLTAFERIGPALHYTPNAFLGVGITLLLVGRFVYRFTALYGGAMHGGIDPVSVDQSPLTRLLFGLTLGYYLAYSAGLLWRGRTLAAAGGMP